MAKIPKKTLATRNPAIGEFMRALLRLLTGLSVQIPDGSGSPSPERCGLDHHADHCQRQKHNG
jgi:hypothetical protein